MDLVNEIKEIVTLQNPHEKDSRLEHLSDTFEYHADYSEEDLLESVSLLIFEALRENDSWVKESLFNAMSSAVLYYQNKNIGSRINWDPLAASLPSLGLDCLPYALSILGFSGQTKYLPILSEYIHHSDDDVSNSARSATTELEDTIAHAPDPPQKEG